MCFKIFPWVCTSFSAPQLHVWKQAFCNTAAVSQLHWSHLGSEEHVTWMVLISYFHLKPVSMCSPHSPRPSCLESSRKRKPARRMQLHSVQIPIDWRYKSYRGQTCPAVKLLKHWQSAPCHLHPSGGQMVAVVLQFREGEKYRARWSIFSVDHLLAS